MDTLRRYVADLPEKQTGWLAGARDPIVGKSLGLLHTALRILDNRGSGGRGGYFPVRPGGALHPISIGAPDDLFDSVEASVGCAGAREDTQERGGNRSRRRLRIRGGIHRAFKREFGPPPGDTAAITRKHGAGRLLRRQASFNREGKFRHL